MPRSARTLLALAAALLFAGCGSDEPGSSGGVAVVATTTIVGDLARQVGGDAASVTQLLNANTDAHEYEPRPDDVVAVAGADVVLQSGDGLDRWASDVVEQSGTDAPLVDLAAKLQVRRPGEREGDEASRYDPHWWHDPRNVVTAVGEIRDALTAADPGDKATYARNAAAYTARVEALDAAIARCFASIAPAARKLVTDHDAFGYFAGRYDLEVVGAVIPSQTTGAQSSAADVAALTRLIEREDVKAIFPERSLNQKLARAIADQAGVLAGDELYGDSLGEDGTPGATYLGMQAANADAIVDGLTGGSKRCEAPAA